MKTKLFTLAVAVLGIPMLAYAMTVPAAPAGLCSDQGVAVKVINFLLSLIGQGPLC